MPKRKFQPNRDKIQKKQGFLKRMSSKNGRAVIKRRKQKGRVRLTK